MNFKIDENVKSEERKPIKPPKEFSVKDNPKMASVFPNGYKFPVAELSEVSMSEDYEDKNGDIRQTLSFTFVEKSKETTKEHIHTEYDIESDDEKLDVKLEGMKSRIKHIFENTIGKFVPMGDNASNFKELFKDIEAKFNEKNEEGNLAFKGNKCYIKVTYYNGRLSFPLYPSFLQIAKDKNTKCLLDVNKKRDNIVDDGDTGSNNPPSVPGSNSGGVSQDFDSEFD